MQASKCSECGSQEHESTRCPELVAPLYQTGFFQPAGGRPQGGDEEDEALYIRAKPYQKLDNAALPSYSSTLSKKT